MAAAAGVADRAPFEEQLTQVTLWLKKKFGDARVPRYEVNKRTVDILYDVMEFNEERDKDVMLLIEDMKDQAAKYEAEAGKLQDILKESLGLSEDSLSKEASKDFNDLVKGAMELEVENMSLTSFYCAINYMAFELYKTKSKNAKMKLELKTLRKKLASARMMEKKLEEDTEKTKESQETERIRAEMRSSNLEFLEKKTEELKIEIKQAENKLIDMGMDQSLTHEALVASSQELAALHKKIEPLKKEVESYHELPLSIPLARVKVEEAKLELKAVDSELTRVVEAVPWELT